MKLCKRAALAAVLVLAIAAGAALAPAAHGQSFAWEAAPQALQVFTGGGRLGVSVRDVTDEDVKSSKLPGRSGVVIDEVSGESPAEKAGFRKGDVIAEFDGERVRSARQFARLVQETAAGRSVQASVVRDGQRTTLTVEPRDDDRIGILRDRAFKELVRPAPAPKAIMPRVVPDIETFIRSGRTLGVTVTDLSPQLGEHFGAKAGVLVTSVTTDSAAAKAGLKAGDVLTAVGDTTVDDAADVRRAVTRLQAGAEFTLQIVRDKRTMTLKGKMEEAPARRGVTRTIRTVRV